MASRAFSNTELREEASLSAFMSGVHQLQIRQKLLEDDVNTFEQATRLAVKMERIAEATDNKLVDPDSMDADFNVLKIQQGPNNQHINTNPSSDNASHRPDLQNNVTCHYCGFKGHRLIECRKRARELHSPRQTRNENSHITCFYCGIRGHYSSSCPAKSLNNQTSTYRPNQWNQQQYRPSPSENRHHRPTINSNWRQQPSTTPSSTSNATAENTHTHSNLNAQSAGEFPVHPSRRLTF